MKKVKLVDKDKKTLDTIASVDDFKEMLGYTENLHLLVDRVLESDDYEDSDGESSHDDLMSLIMSILLFIWEFNLSKDKGCTDNDVENYICSSYDNILSGNEVHKIWEFLKNEVLCGDSDIESPGLFYTADSGIPVDVPYIIKERDVDKPYYCYKVSQIGYAVLRVNALLKNMIENNKGLVLAS